MASQHLYTLTDLEERTGYPGRTIRSWVSSGVLPPPLGRGPGAHWSERHMDCLQFFNRVREHTPRRLSHEEMRNVLGSLSEEQISRVAKGEEPLDVVDLIGAAEPATQDAVRSAPHSRYTNPGAHKRSEKRPYWTTIEVMEDLELRMRSDDPERVAWLARMARKLREWSEDAG